MASRGRFNINGLDLSPADKRALNAELQRIRKSSSGSSASKVKKLIADAESALRKKLGIRRKKAKIRLQDSRFKKFLKKATFAGDKKFFSGLGPLFRNRKFRNSIISSAPEVAESFIGTANFKKLEKLRKSFAANRDLRVRRVGLALGLAAVGFAIARSDSGIRRRRRSVGRPRSSRRVGRPSAKRRVGRPSLRGRR